VEEHAYETYNHFLNEFEMELKNRQSTETAKRYYRDGDNLFDAMHTCSGATSSRRPNVDTLYDVFVAIRDDEREHVRTMEYLQEQESDIDLCNI
jgi:ubiquinol oxidase